MSNVSREIDTQPNRNDKSVAGNHVYSQAPEVHEPGHFHDGGKHAEDDKASTPETAEENDDGDENGNHGGTNILVELPLYHLVSHPVCIPTNTVFKKLIVEIVILQGPYIA